MRSIALFSAMLPLLALAQTNWTVFVGGSIISPPLPYYNPQFLTILVGDSVTWQNQSGSHNVNGSTTLYPGNPEGFSSGNPQGGSWTFGKRFTIPGVYNYHCTQQGHAATQFGQITVNNPSGVDELPAEEVTLFPQPSNDMLHVELGTLRVRTAEVFDLEGRRVHEQAVNGASRLSVLVAGWSQGMYFLRLVDEQGAAITRPFRKE